MNQLYGVPKYGMAGKQLGKQFRASDFTSGKLKVYWAPGQTCNWNRAGANFTVLPYQNPSGWPKPNFLLGLPKVVRFILNFGTLNTGIRIGLWRTVALALRTQLQAKYSNLYVILVQVSNTVPDAQAQFFVRWIATLAPIDYNADFLGTDVFNIVISQDYGLTRQVSDSQYYDNPAGGESPPAIVEPSPNYLSETLLVKTAFPNFRRLTTNVYHDTGIASDDTHGQVVAFPAVNATWQVWWQNVVTNSGAYGSMGLKSYDFHQGADVNCNTTDASFFISEVKKHFGL